MTVPDNIKISQFKIIEILRLLLAEGTTKN